MVAAELRRQIVTGRLKPGDKLHPENVLQNEFAISRPTMREALRLLEAESLITIKRGKHGGARVTADRPRRSRRARSACSCSWLAPRWKTCGSPAR